jgi:Carboxypeptidase regulatory-like domain
MRKPFVLAVALLFVLTAIPAYAQTTNATLGGTVTDSTGALIPGVSITATNTQTGIVSKLVTNEAGAYQFASLQTGTYNVRAELPGFQTQTREAALGISQQVRLNFSLQVGTVSTTVDVSAQTDTVIASTSASVGTVLPEYKVRDLPLATRNVLDLVNTTAGVQGSNFAGARLTQLNTTRDGIPVSDGRYDIGAATSTYVSPDLVEELRVIVAPADAEVGRGSGQIQMVTRSGTNQYHGSVFWSNRNSFLNANTWNNNFNGVGKDYLNGNQFGARVAGPILANKTFFFFLYDGQRFITKNYFTGTVLTEQARLGNFRYFSGVQNANAVQINPTVDKAGNPILNGSPATPLSVSVFGKDPLRPGMDTSGWVTRLIGRMPLPNDFTVGDGLNTAGIRWLRRVEGQDVTNGDGQDTNRNQYNVRIDHSFNSANKASFSGSWERDWAMNDQAGISNWPGGYNGKVLRKPYVLTGSLVSTLSSSLLNEFRVGVRKQWNYSWSSIWRPDSVGDDARAALPTSNGTPFFPSHILFPGNIITNVSGAATRGQTSPLLDFNDTLSWTKGSHSFKGGFEVRLTSSRGFNGSDNPEWVQFPVVTIGAGGTAVTGINTTNFPGLSGTNVTTAQNLLLDLAGSVSNLSLQFNVHSPTDQVFTAPVRVKNYHQNEWAAFVKDDWKIRSNLTLNVGIRYDFYGVPWEDSGMQAVPVGGNAGLYGISAGALTQLQLVGKNSNHPDTLLYQNDWNNFGPAVGFSWTLPWFGKDKTVVRGGYAISYHGAASFNAGLNIASGNNPGLSYIQNLTTLGLGASSFNLASSNLPVPVPPPTGIAPLAVEPLDLRINPLAGFDQNRVNPYVQNYHFEIQRELARNLTFQVRYIGSKGTKLYSGVSLNDVDVFHNGILDAFNTTRAGGDAALFDQMLKGLTLNTGTNGSLGQGVIGTNTTASAALRQNNFFRTLLANGNVGQFASTLNTSTTVTGKAGGLVRNGGFPDNFIVPNPQYAAVVMNTNPGSSTYHALDLELTKRLSHGFTTQFSYIWSRSLSDASTDGNLEYLDPSNHSLNHTLTTFHRTHDIRSNGTLELPFGPNRKFLANGNSIVTRLVERWQLGGIFSWTSGAPLTITASNSEVTWTPVPGQIAIVRTANTPLILGNFPKSTGKVTRIDVGATYFPGFTQVADPSNNNVTTAQTLQSVVSNRALQDASGKTVLANPAPGTVGTLGRSWIEGPSHIGLDANLIKRVKIAEKTEFEFRMDVVNVLNTPYWPNPNVDINSGSFGKITTTDATGANNADLKSGNRRFVFNARVNF